MSVDRPGPRTSSVHSDCLVSVLIVVRNDERIMRDFIADVQTALAQAYAFYEVLFIDLQSTDGTVATLHAAMQQYPNMRLIRLSSRADIETGVTAGLDNCIGDLIVVMDPYLDRPEDIPRLVEASRAGYDVVIGRRIGGPREHRTRRLFYSLANKILSQRIDPDDSEFRLLTRKAIVAITKFKHRRRHLRYFTELLGFKKTHVDCTPDERAAAMPHRRTFWTSARRSIDLVISNSAMPLRLAAGLGVLASFGSMAYLLYALVIALVKERIAEGWLTTSVIISTMFFCLFLIVSVMSEYIARILDESQDRPLYFIEFEDQSTVSSLSDKELLNVVEAP